MEKIKEIYNKSVEIFEYIIGILLAVCLFLGAFGFLGYMIAFIIGGETAVIICEWIYNSFYKVLIKISTITTFITFILQYLNGNAKWVNPLSSLKKK